MQAARDRNYRQYLCTAHRGIGRAALVPCSRPRRQHVALTTFGQALALRTTSPVYSHDIWRSVADIQFV